jgi:hypothetical protein
MSESPKGRQDQWEGQFLPSSLAIRDLSFFCLASGCRVRPLSLGAPSAADGAVFGGRKSTSCSRRPRDPGRGKRLLNRL